MISISIEGNDVDEYLEDCLLDAAYFFCTELLPKHKKLEVDIIVEIDRESKLEGYTGFVEKVGRHQYEIYINKEQPLGTCIISLAHEFIHIKQYEKGELKMLEEQQKLLWFGKPYEYDRAYDDIPWEDECFAKENELYYKWLVKIDK